MAVGENGSDAGSSAGVLGRGVCPPISISPPVSGFWWLRVPTEVKPGVGSLVGVPGRGVSPPVSDP